MTDGVLSVSTTANLIDYNNLVLTEARSTFPWEEHQVLNYIFQYQVDICKGCLYCKNV